MFIIFSENDLASASAINLEDMKAIRLVIITKGLEMAGCFETESSNESISHFR